MKVNFLKKISPSLIMLMCTSVASSTVSNSYALSSPDIENFNLLKISKTAHSYIELADYYLSRKPLPPVRGWFWSVDKSHDERYRTRQYFQLLKKAAHMNDPEGQYRYANALKDLGLRISDNKATNSYIVRSFKHYLRSAEQGHPGACLNVLISERDGLGNSVGTLASANSSYDWMLHASHRHLLYRAKIFLSNNAELNFLFSEIFEKSYIENCGDGKDNDHEKQAWTSIMANWNKHLELHIEEAFKWFTLASEQGHEEAMDCMFSICIERNYASDPEGSLAMKAGLYFENNHKLKHQARTAFEISAERGNIDAQYRLGIMDIDSGGTVKNFQYLKAAYLQGHPDALEKIFLLANKNNIDALLFVSDYYEKHAQPFITYLEKAANLRSILACYKLAGLYLNGKGGVNKNIEKALGYYKQAADQGHGLSNLALGKYYFMQNKEVDLAYNYYKKAKEQYCNEAVIPFEKCCRERYQNFLSKDQDRNSQFSLGIIYSLGEGVQASEKESFLWFKKAADQGHPEAEFRVAECYRLGKGAQQNDREAFEYCKRSAENGYQKAQNALGKFKLNLINVRNLLNIIDEGSVREKFRLLSLDKQRLVFSKFIALFTSSDGKAYFINNIKEDFQTNARLFAQTPDARALEANFQIIQKQMNIPDWYSYEKEGYRIIANGNLERYKQAYS